MDWGHLMHRFLLGGVFSLAAILASTTAAHALTCSTANGAGISESDGNVATFSGQTFSVTLQPGESMTLRFAPIGAASQHNIQVDGSTKSFDNNAGTAQSANVSVSNSGASARTYSINVFVHEGTFSISTSCSGSASGPSSHIVGTDAKDIMANSFWGLIGGLLGGGISGSVRANAIDQEQISARSRALTAQLINGRGVQYQEPDLLGNPTNETSKPLFYQAQPSAGRISRTLDILAAYADAGNYPDTLDNAAPINSDWGLKMRFDGAFTNSNINDSRSLSGSLGLSLTHRLDERFTVGGHLLVGTWEASSASLNTNVRGSNVGFGSNVVIHLSPEAALNLGSFYIFGADRSSTGTVVDKYNTHQLGGGATLQSTRELANDIMLTTFGSLRYTALLRDRSVDSSGATSAAYNTQRLTGEVGATFSKFVTLDDSYFSAANLSATIGASAAAANEHFSTGNNSFTTASASIRGGVDLLAHNGMTVNLNAGVSGIGGRYTSYHGGAQLSIPLP